jgi:bacteriorhodopsin
MGTKPTGPAEAHLLVSSSTAFQIMSTLQRLTMLVGEGAKLDVHGCKTVDMASSFGKALLEFIFIVMAAITLLIGVNAGKSKAAGKVLYPATFTCGIAAIAYFAMASGGGWVIAPDCRQLFVARYLDWAITTPLILIDLGVVAGVSKWDILALVLSDGEFLHKFIV